MTSDPRTAAQPALPVPGGGDLLGELITVLADALGVKAEAIDPEQPFHLLGLDSMLTVEFVAVVNARYGTRIKATALYDHPTPAAFARHVAPQLGVLGPQPAPGPAPAPAAGAEQVVDVLRTELARILCCEPWDIDADAAFHLLGLDSILGAEFVAVVNRTYGLDERAVTLYDHPSLNAMAAYVASRTGLPAARTLPGPALRSRTQAPSGPAGPTDLEALLDAVRDNRLSVDEAAAVLAGRAA
ncbi:acyl carrier protein [Streptomyces albicerus]|jgi:polyketide synthase PksN|uniref:acyl carrier protein n=1 Tax=Streptomyces albicerus TaxID=2569859 RepID=UPI00124AE6E9|nr:acyl carrier protein [Streptomyces albicerus]